MPRRAYHALLRRRAFLVGRSLLCCSCARRAAQPRRAARPGSSRSSSTLDAALLRRDRSGLRRTPEPRARAIVAASADARAAQRSCSRIVPTVPDASTAGATDVVAERHRRRRSRDRSSARARAAMPGVTAVYPSVTYRALARPRPGADRRADGLGCRRSRPPGQGMKIGIIDDGVDQTHPYFDPAGFTYAARASRRADKRYTTPKVIVARAFAPRAPDLEVRAAAVRPAELRARDARRRHRRRRPRHVEAPGEGAASCPGVAPKAYIGNYKVLSVPTRVRPERQLARDRRRDRGGRRRTGWT